MGALFTPIAHGKHPKLVSRHLSEQTARDWLKQRAPPGEDPTTILGVPDDIEAAVVCAARCRKEFHMVRLVVPHETLGDVMASKSGSGVRQTTKGTKRPAAKSSSVLRESANRATSSRNKKGTAHSNSGRSAVSGRFTAVGTSKSFRGFGGTAGARGERPMPPTPYSPPAGPAAPSERVRGERTVALPATRGDRKVALPEPGTRTGRENVASDSDTTLLRFLDPNFFLDRLKSEWIGEIASSNATVRMGLARHGLPAQAVAALADALDMSRDELTREMGLPRSTVERKLREGGHLGQAESERVLGVVRLIGQVRRIVEESGDPTGFDAPLWVAHWLQTPVPALGGRPPMAYMDTAEGRAVVSQLVEQMQSGAYA